MKRAADISDDVIDIKQMKVEIPEMDETENEVLMGMTDDTDEAAMVISEMAEETMVPSIIDTEVAEETVGSPDGLQPVQEVNLNPPPEFQNIVVQHMDISEPLNVLRKLLEGKLQCSLQNHSFYLQDQILLDSSRSLVDQCVQGEGMVQINVEIKSHPGISPRINIVDVLKQTEEVIEAPVETMAPVMHKVTPAPEQEHVTKWVVDQAFRREQERLKIPTDPSQWSNNHVKHWITWAVNEFELVGVDIANFDFDGSRLCSLKHDEFTRYIPNDKGDLFWTHLELLRKCKFVAVVQQPPPHAVRTVTVSTSKYPRTFVKQGKQTRGYRLLGEDRTLPGNRTGNNGQIQLWQFLLECLTDKECREIIHWVGDEGEFKLNHPELVAQLWGQRKNKPTMTYEKLSRALRYYYDGDMISKVGGVHGKRFVYKFVCDLKNLLGYNPGELNKLVQESAERSLRKIRANLSTTQMPSSGIGGTPLILKKMGMQEYVVE